MKITEFKDFEDVVIGVIFDCPHCGVHRRIPVNGVNGEGGPFWSYNLNPESPTLEPSLKTRFTDENGEQMCHCWVRDGVVVVLTDSTCGTPGSYPMPEIEVEPSR
jgi:hypothetical protein